MPFKSVKVIRLNVPTKQSAYSLHSAAPVGATTIIAELLFDFSTDKQGQFDFTSNNFIKDVPFRSVYIDLSQTDSPIIVSSFSEPSYGPISLVGRTQGWFPVLWNEPLHILVQYNGGFQFPFIILRFANLLIPGPVWRTQ